MSDHARAASNLVQVRDGRSFEDLGLHELPWPNAEVGDMIEIDGAAWHVVDVVPAKVDSAVIAVVAVEPLAVFGI
jgi:hypothetical protein